MFEANLQYTFSAVKELRLGVVVCKALYQAAQFFQVPMQSFARSAVKVNNQQSLKVVQSKMVFLFQHGCVTRKVTHAHTVCH